MKYALSTKPMTSELKNVLSPFLEDNNVRFENMYNGRSIRLFVTATFDTTDNRTSEKISEFHIRANFQPKNFMHCPERDLFEIVAPEELNSRIVFPNWENLYDRQKQPEYISLDFARTGLWRFLLQLTNPDLKTKLSWCLIKHGFDKIAAATDSGQEALLKITEPGIQVVRVK